MRRSIHIVVLFLAFGIAPLALADSKSDSAAHYKAGMAYKAQGKNDEAIESLEKAVAADANHAEAWASLGHLYKQKGDLKK